MTSLSWVALTITPHTGRSLGLSHAAAPPPTELWQPIMRASSADAPLSRWVAVPGLQDPVAVMASHGVRARADDHADSADSADSAAAGPLGDPADLAGSGVISTRDDVDVFRLESGRGELASAVLPAALGPKLDIRAELLDADAAFVETSDPRSDSIPAGLAPSITGTVGSGTYYLRVDGVGDASGGWDDYGSLGQFTITGSVGPARSIGDLVVSSTDICEGESVTVSGTYAGGNGAPTAEARWSDGATTPVEDGNETATPTTRRAFADYEPPGTEADAFTVEITLSDGKGSRSATSPVVTVRNVAPTIVGRAADDSAALPGAPVTIRGAFTDPADGIATKSFELRAEWDDGAITKVDRCPGTLLPESPASRNQPHRFTVVDDGRFVSGAGVVGPSREAAGGCSAAQIAEALGVGAGHSRFGISEGA